MSTTPGDASYSAAFGQSAYDQFIGRGQAITLETVSNLEGSGITPHEPTLGLSASVNDVCGLLKIAHVNEVLGTKYHDAEQLRKSGGPNLYRVVGHDALAMVLNDLSAVGARPFDIKLFFANQGKQWFDDTERTEEFYKGWHEGCDLAKSWFSGGETAGLHCTIVEDEAVFSGSAVGVIYNDEHVYDGTTVQVGDRIIGWRSHGLMCNGFTLVHTKFIPALPNGYMTELEGGQTVGEALMEKTDFVAPAVRAFRKAKLKVRMINNITGHGWAKIMRAAVPFDYVIEELPPVPPIFTLMEQTLSMPLEDAYGDYNRGLAGVVICDEADYRFVMANMSNKGLQPFELGHVSAPAMEGKSRVVIVPDNVTLVAK